MLKLTLLGSLSMFSTCHISEWQQNIAKFKALYERKNTIKPIFLQVTQVHIYLIGNTHNWWQKFVKTEKKIWVLVQKHV